MKINVKEILERRGKEFVDCELLELANWCAKMKSTASEVRRLQKEYFKTRDREVLIASKKAEKEMDRLLAEVSE